MVEYNIISSGSKGNAVVLERSVLIDCGVSYKQISPFTPELRLVLLTHAHGDHFKSSTVRALAESRPTLRFGCCEWMAKPLLDAGVLARQIDIYEPGDMYGYPGCKVCPVPLTHNVPNIGYKIHLQTGKVFYATDTGNLDGIRAPQYDLYLVEANYEDEEIQRRIVEKIESGKFPYEKRVLRDHLSKAQADEFIYQNIGPNGVYVYMHQHEGEATE